MCRPGEPCVGPVPMGPAPENAWHPGWSSGRPSLPLGRSSPSRRDLGLLGRTGGCAGLQNRSPGARGAGRQDIWGAVPPSRGRGNWKRPAGWPAGLREQHQGSRAPARQGGAWRERGGWADPRPGSPRSPGKDLRLCVEGGGFGATVQPVLFLPVSLARGGQTEGG